ncbi:MAG: hypothetical protein AAGF74_11650 [Pseudomonadota bacterium]
MIAYVVRTAFILAGFVLAGAAFAVAPGISGLPFAVVFVIVGNTLGTRAYRRFVAVPLTDQEDRPL